MADISPESTTGTIQGGHTLPEIPLKWEDFDWSLEKLRHRPYGKKTRERDWFRINPLEMVLLGAQSIATDTHAKRDHGTMVLVMPPLRRELCVRPRYWQRLITVLYQVTQETDTPSTVAQRCCTVLVDLLKALETAQEFSPAVKVWAVHELKMVEGLERLLEERQILRVHLSLDLDRLFGSLKATPHQSDSCWGELTATEKTEEIPTSERVKLSVFLRAVLDSCPVVTSSQPLQMQLNEMLKKDVDVPSSILGISWGPFEDLLGYTTKTSPQALTRLLSIVQLVFVRGSDIEEHSTSPRSDDETTPPDRKQLQQTTPTPPVDGYQANSIPPTDDDLIVEEDTETDGESVEQEEEPLLAALFKALLACFRKWEALCSPDPTSLSAVICKLLSLTETILAAYPLHSSPAAHFLHQPISLLMTYSTEGYLSNSPSEFFLELMEFVTTLVEHGTPPYQALQTNLPNLFGPVFGVHDHSVSCQLLEYGSLAVCSQHKRLLLSEGLSFLVNTFHLFPPVDTVIAHAQAAHLRREAVEVCNHLLEELVTALPLEDEGALEPGSGHSGREMATGSEDAEGGEDQPPVDGGASKEASPSDQPLATEAERDTDKTARIQVLLRLIKLACMMVRRGDNISFLYASVLPKLFEQPPSHEVIVDFNSKKLTKFFGEEPPPPSSYITWRVDRKKLAIQLLDLTILSLHNDVTTPFQLCGIVAPKLIKNVDRLMSLSDEEKLSLTLNVLQTTQDILGEGHDINDFMSYGIDLLATLLPDTASGDEFRQFSSQLARHFVASSQSSLLFLIKNACQFMTHHFPAEERGIRDLFSSLVFKGRRDEIRGVFRVCKLQLTKERYSSVRQHMYGFASGRLSHKQLLAVCELLVLAMDVETPHRAVREVVTNITEEPEDLVHEKEEQKMGVVSQLTAPCLKSIEEALEDGRFKKDVWEGISQQLSRVALYTTLFQSDFTAVSSLSTDKLIDIFTQKFPREVLASHETMQLLVSCATRIEHMQSPRYDSLKFLLSSHLRHFLTLTPSQATPTSQDEAIEPKHDVMWRMCELEQYLAASPRNIEDKKQLLECGYSNRLWEEGISLSVRTDGSRSLEENMRQTLLACYTEFSQILLQMGITHVSVDGELVKSSELFNDQLSLAELKGRRAVAVRVIDQRLGQSKDGHFYERKVTLLSREDQIEGDFESQSQVPVKPKTFTVTLNTSFFNCARCCGPQIIGCYAPNGEHCERPLEIGMRCDSGIASICDESGLEIENAEILFTHEGAYFFKAYSNGHPYDTSQVWTSLFMALLREESSASCLVPAIIIPCGYPNTRTWEALRRVVSTEITGSVLTCRHDFSPEWRTYYDHKPEIVRLGTDIFLTPGFSLTSTEGRPSLQRQRSRLTKDLPGAMFEDVMQQLLEDEWLEQFRFLGKVMSEYISVCIREGDRRVSILDRGFNYDRWARTGSKSKSSATVPSKEEIVRQLASFIDREMATWLEGKDLRELCGTNHKQLLELKHFLEKDGHFTMVTTIKEKLLLVRRLLGQCTVVMPIAALPDALQEEIIHWVFGNEDRVWRYRGGRDGHETLQQFMYFLGKPRMSEVTGQGSDKESEGIPSQPRKVYPGVVAFCLPELLEKEPGQQHSSPDISNLQVRQMVGYAVGEMMTSSLSLRDDQVMEGTRWQPNTPDRCYEVVTAWVHPNYRGLNMGVQMYFNIVEQAPARLVMCDMLVGSVERIVQSNVLLRLLQRVRIVGMVVQKRQLSYTVVTQTGHSEQFEQVLFDARPLRLMLKLHRAVKWCRAHPKLTIATVTTVFSIPVVYIALTVFKQN
ncbi:uncharacterized protein LOC135332129 isoform X2 [Halichondria panicea]|uniref:uncharacterized protein LOC135332129 isoform X2 n=1 Tax=Halichondria panicea TaxID=6063 RepID=UPI00312BA5B7